VLSASREIIPYFVQGDSDYIDRTIDAGKMFELFEDQSIIALGVGHLPLRSYLDFETQYGELLDAYVNKILWVFYAMGQIANENIPVDQKPELKIVDGVTTTPYGPMYGSLQKNVAEAMAFLLVQFGRIVGTNADGTYQFESMNQNDIYELLDVASLMSVDEGSTGPAFFDLINIAGLTPVVEGDESTEKDDGPKNLVSLIKGEPSTTGSKRQGSSRSKPNKAT
jgi:hypothetical protein